MALKVLHCPTSTGAQGWYLSRAERKLGLESDVLITKSHAFDYPADFNLKLETMNPLSAAVTKIKTFYELIDRYDVFHFNYGSSLIDFPHAGLHHLDFPVLKQKGKKIFVTYQGCDSRIGSFCRRHFETSVCHYERHWHCSWPADLIKKARIRKALKYADKVFALNPDLMHNIPGAELMLYAITDLEDIRPCDTPSAEPYRILHAPSNKRIKGTDQVERVIKWLREDGFNVELVLVTNKSNAEARELYKNCHIAIDQLYAGWYGAFAVEAMAMGKPVLCYLRQGDLDKYVPFKSEIPLVNTSSETLQQDLKILLKDSVLREEIGRRGRAYVEKYHNTETMAKRLLKYYLGSPEEVKNTAEYQFS